MRLLFYVKKSHVFGRQKDFTNRKFLHKINMADKNIRSDRMAVEKRCTCEDDFIHLFIQTASALNQSSYGLKEGMASRVWQDLLTKESQFFNKHGYIDVVYNAESETYSRIKQIGRPPVIKRKENRITVRLNDEQMNDLESYCVKHNIQEKAEAIRIAISKLNEHSK
jgi:hypothetical protein